MTRVIEELVEDALRELADRHIQATLWTASGGAEVSSLAEAKSRLWDDSFLSDAMDRGVVYTPGIDAQLRQLRNVLHRIDENTPVEKLLESPELASARALAQGILNALRQLGRELGAP